MKLPLYMMQALLSRLYTVGPSTDGIFRKSASVRKIREVKEKLEAGAGVNFDDVSALVCAALLKVTFTNYIYLLCLWLSCSLIFL